MKRIVILLAITAITVMVFAPAAAAQVVPVGPGFDQPKIEPMPGSAFGPSPAYDPKNKAAANGGAAAPKASPAPAPKANPTAPPKATAKELPKTGGTSLAMPVALALVVSGFAALRLIRRRGAVS